MMKKYIFIVFFLCCTLSFSQLAFPGVRGFGKNTTGGRGGTVVHVTNLNDSGTGSLRAALEMVGDRYIVCDVSGVITLLTPITIEHDEGNFTFAGETAPSPGITVRDYPIKISGSNIIIRYLTVATGGVGTAATSTDYDAIEIGHIGTPANYDIENIVLDHVSVRWATDENLSIDGESSTKQTRNITIQSSILGQPINSSGYNMLLLNNYYNISLYDNFLTHSVDRNPLVGNDQLTESMEMVGNVIYGFDGGMTVGFGSNVDLLGNVFREASNIAPFNTIVSYGTNGCGSCDGTSGDFFVADNYYIGSGETFYDPDIATNNPGSRFFTTSDFTTYETSQAQIVANVINSDTGNSLYRDTVDAGFFTDYANGTATHYTGTTPTYPSVSSGSHPAGYDTDNDGMADAWEISRSGSIALTANGDDDSDGYTNIEEFFHYRASSESGSGGGSPIPTGLKRNFFNKKKGFF